MSFIIWLLVLLFWFALNIGIGVLLRAYKSGKFEVVRDDDQAFSFVSSTGNFNIYPSRKLLGYDLKTGRGTLSFDELAGIEYRVEERDASFSALFFGSFFTGQYATTREWFCINVATHDGPRFPLYLGNRLEPRHPLMGWLFALETAMLTRFGLLKDTEVESREAYELIRSRLGNLRQL